MHFSNPPPDEIARLLREAKTVAVVGVSPNPWRPANEIAEYLLENGYRVIPVNPLLSEWNGARVYPDLRAIPEKIDIVDVFRRSAYAGAHADEAIAVGAKALWFQDGVIDEAAAARARAAGLFVVMDRCILRDHARLLSV
jgi:hypothetical protein